MWTKKAEDEFWEKYLYEYAKNEPARKFASEVINKLKDEGKEIYIITARYLTDMDTNDLKKCESRERGSFEELEILKNNKYNFKTKLKILQKKILYNNFTKQNHKN